MLILVHSKIVIVNAMVKSLMAYFYFHDQFSNNVWLCLFNLRCCFHNSIILTIFMSTDFKYLRQVKNFDSVDSRVMGGLFCVCKKKCSPLVKWHIIN